MAYHLKLLVFRVNIEMLGALLKNAAINMQFGYVLYVMDIVKQEKLKVNTAFLRHLETFNDRCIRSIEKVSLIQQLFHIRNNNHIN